MSPLVSALAASATSSLRVRRIQDLPAGKYPLVIEVIFDKGPRPKGVLPGRVWFNRLTTKPVETAESPVKPGAAKEKRTLDFFKK
jgi:hypothetical protein